MDKQLTIVDVIKVLEKIRKEHGDGVLVYHTEFGDIVKSRNIVASEIIDEVDGNETRKIVVIR
jgi:hypothetical protein